jgi:hypothetical protein
VAADGCGWSPLRPTGRTFRTRPAVKRRSAAGAGVAVGNGADLPGTRPEAAVGALMPYHDVQPPDLLPILSPGKHRSPRTGACFMELASLLAGERWSDHPACTHPLLAALARHVNDHTSDAGRQRLTELIPSVIGLTGDDPHIDARVALRSATMALPVVAAGRQRVMAVSVLACDRVLAELDGRPAGSLEEQSRLALAKVPHATEWAYRFTSGVRPSAKGFRRQAAPTIVQDAVDGIAQACVPDPDGMLRDLLVQAIDVCAAWIGPGRDRGGMGGSRALGRRRVQGRAGTKEDRNHHGTVERERLLRQLQQLRRAVPDEGTPRAGQQLEEGAHPIRLLRELRPAGLLTAGRGAP